MNYIDITSEDVQTLQVNTNLDVVSDPVTWTISKEGNDDSTEVINTPDGLNTLIDNGYNQTLRLDLFGEGISANFDNESQYTIEGLSNGKVIYRGKLLTTSKDISNFSVNENKYKEKTSTNNYIILE